MFATFSSKTQCLSAKVDSLTSKQIGVCSKNVVFLPVAKPFLAVFFTAQNTYTHTHTSIRKSVFGSKFPSNCELPCVYECMCFWCMSVWVRARVAGRTPATTTQNRFLTSLQNTRWKLLLGAVLSHFLGPGAQGPFSAFFRVVFHPKLVYRSVCILAVKHSKNTYTHSVCVCTRTI